jgi:hypothetical protein
MIGVEYRLTKRENESKSKESKRKKNESNFISIIKIIEYIHTISIIKSSSFFGSISIMGIYKQNHQDCDKISCTCDNGFIDARKFFFILDLFFSYWCLRNRTSEYTTIEEERCY